MIDKHVEYTDDGEEYVVQSINTRIANVELVNGEFLIFLRTIDGEATSGDVNELARALAEIADAMDIEARNA